jgi:hypothetical protein
MDVGTRFWPKVEVRESGQCWPWMGGRDRYGYGKFTLTPRKTLKAHRLAFELTHGYVAQIARHTCDNRICCNPDHLLDGTVADNNADMMAKGRHRSGGGKLTPAEVLEIRRAYAAGEASQQALGGQFGVSQASVSYHVRRL